MSADITPPGGAEWSGPDPVAWDRPTGDPPFAGGEDAFRSVFDRYGPRMTELALRFLDDPEAAEDAVQDVFLTLWRSRGRLPAIGNLNGYLLYAVRNRCLNLLRRRRRERQWRARATPGWSVSPVELLEAEETLSQLGAAVDALPPRTRDVFVRSRIDGLTYREIASARGVSVKTIETLMGRALRTLRAAVAA